MNNINIISSKKCNICDSVVTQRCISISRRRIGRISIDDQTIEAIMNIYYIKIHNKTKFYLCRQCFKNMSYIPSFYNIMNSQLTGIRVKKK